MAIPDIREFRRTPIYSTWKRRAWKLGALAAVGTLVFAIIDLGFMSPMFRRELASILVSCVGVGLVVAILTIVAAFFIWLFSLLDLGFQRIGYVLAPISLLSGYWYFSWEFHRAWGRRFWVDFVLDGLLPVLGVAAAIMAVYIVGVHAWYWVREGFRQNNES